MGKLECIASALLILLFLPIFLAIAIASLFTRNFSRKCKYAKVCPNYDKESVVCNQDGGRYSFDSLGNCYLDIAEGKVLPLKR